MKKWKEEKKDEKRKKCSDWSDQIETGQKTTWTSVTSEK